MGLARPLLCGALLLCLLSGCSSSEARRGLSVAEAEDGDAAFDDNVLADLGKSCRTRRRLEAICTVASFQSLRCAAVACAVLIFIIICHSIAAVFDRVFVKPPSLELQKLACDLQALH